ncbi:MAG TPA: hypothetical protein VL970_03780, partial [Candidatus Acidoferrales bacterium]|nr:hypothetical protein [Candidatus Acidoferrales bacterium]
MNSLPSVDEMLALLDALRKNVRDFAAREQKLESDFRQGTATELRDFAARNEAQETAAHEREVHAAETLRAEQDECRARFERRKAWLNRAHSAMSRRVLQNISEQDAQWKERTQQGVQEAELKRDEALAAASAVYEDLQTRLQEASHILSVQESSARQVFGGYGRFRRLLALDRPCPEADLAADHTALFAALQALQQKITEEIARFKKLPLPLLFRFLPFWLLAVALLGVAAADPIGQHFGKIWMSHSAAGFASAGFVLVTAIYFLGGRLAAPAATTLAGDLARARRLFEACLDKSAAHWQNEQARIKSGFEETKQAFNQAWRRAVRDISSRRGEEPAVINDKAARIAAGIERQREAALERLQKHQTERLADLKAADQAQFQALAGAHQARMSQFETGHKRQWEQLETDWKSCLQPLCEQLRRANDAAEKLCPSWAAAQWKNWTPPAYFQNAVTFARLEGEVEKFIGALPTDPRLKWYGPATISAPLALVCPVQGSILFESGKASGDEAFSAINNIIFRLLAATPPGKLSFTIFDPVGLGQNFAALTHLADYEESSINSRIWT